MMDTMNPYGSSFRQACCTAACLLALCASGQAQATTFYVDDSSPTDGPGTNWSNAYHNPQDAFDAATSIDTIRVAEGTYYPGTSYTNHYWPDNSGSSSNEEATIRLIDEVPVLGAHLGYPSGSLGVQDGSAARTILSGDDGTTEFYHVVVNADTVGTSMEEFDGFLIKDGRALGSNSSRQQDIGGGFLQYVSASTQLDGVWIRESWADSAGGGLYKSAYSDSDLIVRKSLVTDNYSVDGSGIYLEGTTESDQDLNDFCNVRIRGNGDESAPVGSGRPIAEDGSGMWIGPRVELRASNVLMHGNIGTGEGAGVYWEPRNANDGVVNDLHFRHCTITANGLTHTTGTHGAGFYVVGVDPGSGAVNRNAYLFNTIVWGNTGGGTTYDVYAPDNGASEAAFVNLEYTDFGSGSGLGFKNVTGNISSDPEFIDPVNGIYQLDDSVPSPCIDAANNSSTHLGPDFCDLNNNGNPTEDLPLDLNLNTRVINVDPDMGAFEDQ